MFIKNRKQAQTASQIAARHGFDITVAAFLNRYANNVLADAALSNPRTAARVAAEREIVAALKPRRK